jgi:Na+-translocating ferredoxin:NAD+ oxidoreductase RnfG subunit
MPRPLELTALLLPAVFVAQAHATDYLSVAQAQTLLFPAANSFTDATLKLTSDQRDKIKDQAGVRQRTDEVKVWRAERDGQALGWFFVDEVIGKHEFITYATAVGRDGKVLGIEILSYRETHGGQVRDAQWRKNFVGKSLVDRFKLDEDVPNISGATLSCRNLLDGVKRLLVVQQLYLANRA